MNTRTFASGTDGYGCEEVGEVRGARAAQNNCSTATKSGSATTFNRAQRR